MLPGNPPQLTTTRHKLKTIRLNTTRERLAWNIVGTPSGRLVGMYGRDDRDTLMSTLLPNCFCSRRTATMNDLA